MKAADNTEHRTNAAVYQLKDGRFKAVVGIQDGTESSIFATLEEALKCCKETEKVMNGNEIKKKWVPVYEEIQELRSTFRRIR